MDLKQLHEQVLYTQVRVRTDKAGGSGTIIYSKPNDKGDHTTLVLSCHHVIDDALTVKKEWSSKLGVDRKKEYRQIVVVEFFDYSAVPHGHRPINNSVDGEIVAYDTTHDIAIIKLRMTKPAQYVINLMHPDNISSMQIGSPTVACGAALLHDPVITQGIITHLGDEIEFKDYWLSSAQIIFGNSGGAIFADTPRGYEFIGIPSRIAMSASWGSPVTHMGYFSPISRIYKFFDEQSFHFLIPGHPHTELECAAEIKKAREEAEKLLSGTD